MIFSISLKQDSVPSATSTSSAVPSVTSTDSTIVYLNILGLSASIVVISVAVALGVLAYRKIVSYGKKEDEENLN